MTQNMKVALLFLAAIIGLVGIIYLLEGGVIRDAKTIHVEYKFAGGVQTGTPVRVAGIQVGKVRSLEFIGGDPARDTHVRLTIDIDSKAWESVRADSKFYINMAGIIGERYVEVTTGSKDAPQLEPGQTVRGEDPPRLDQLISQGYDVMGEIMEIIERNKPKIEKMIDALDAFLANFDPNDFGDVATLVGRTSSLMRELDRQLPPILRETHPMMQELRPVLRGARPLLDDAGPLLKPTLSNANALLTEATPLVKDMRVVMGDMQKAFGDRDLAEVMDTMLGLVDNVEGTLQAADVLLNNLKFMDQNWLRHFLQVEGIKAAASLGSPNIPDELRPVRPPAYTRPTTGAGNATRR